MSYDGYRGDVAIEQRNGLNRVGSYGEFHQYGIEGHPDGRAHSLGTAALLLRTRLVDWTLQPNPGRTADGEQHPVVVMGTLIRSRPS